jgi:hypothetical protein
MDASMSSVTGAGLSSMADGANDAVSLAVLRKALTAGQGASAQLLASLPPRPAAEPGHIDVYA